MKYNYLPIHPRSRRWVFPLICFALMAADVRADPVPFERQPNFFQVVSGQLNTLDPRDGVYTKIGANNESYNAAGYNIQDDFVYAWGRFAPYKDQLIRIHGDGSFVALGTPTTTGDAVPTFRIYAGDMDFDGHLWVRGDRFYSPDLMKINVETATYEMVRFSGPNPGGVADIVYQKIDGKSYFFGTRNENLYVWDLSTMSVTRWPVKNLPEGRVAYGAAYTDQAGNLYVSSNKGGVYQILNHTTNKPRAVFLLDSVVTGNNDGFSCPVQESPLMIPENQPPTITMEDEALKATGIRRAVIELGIADEGLPLVGDGLSISWTHESGPGTVKFSDPYKARTEMIFPKNGQYVMRCEASDGAITVSEEFLIDVVDDHVAKLETYSRSDADYAHARRMWADVKEQLHCRSHGTLLEQEKRGFNANDFILDQDAEVIVTAVYDGGTYRNTLFWYDQSAPEQQTVVWHSYVLGPKAPLKPGSTASLGVLPAGTALRFGLVVDGARGGDTQVYQDQALNPGGVEQCAARLFGENHRGSLILAFEDQVDGDEDFNDVILQIEIIPRSRGLAQYDDVVPGQLGLHSDRGRRGVEAHMRRLGLNQDIHETLDQLFLLPDAPMQIEFVEDRSSMKFDLCVFDYDRVKHLDPGSLEFRKRAAMLAVSIFDDRRVNPGNVVSFDPRQYGLGGKTVGLMFVPNNTRSVFLRNPSRYTPKGVGNRTKRQPLFSLVNANPGDMDQMLTFSRDGAMAICLEDHSRYEKAGVSEAGNPSDDGFDDAIMIIRGGMSGVNLFDHLYGLPTADPTIGFDGEDGITPRKGRHCY
ncbi:MAG: DUF4114 domain-containing protein [Verrucomicrobiae bacterium]|nr:DUF4114 domain-containing protein [Verrucomicrobiae bacterium]NNJ43601.1 DUF4114 domain-containing protein [Akkermansiaceae bacterium]